MNIAGVDVGSAAKPPDPPWERQEQALINNTEYGLLNNVAPDMRVKARHGSPTTGRSG